MATEPPHLSRTRASYDTVAEDYVGIALPRFHVEPLGRAMLTALDLPDGELGGIVAWWSIFHTPPDLLATVFAEFHRTLALGGSAVIGFHVGDEHLKPTRAYGHPVTYEAYRLEPDRIAELLSGAGLAVTAQMSWEENRPQAVLLARKSA